MPSNWLYVDTNFPAFTGEESTEEKVTAIQNYMYMLVEQLRYSMHNLDLSNMNRTAVQQFSRTITDPIYARIADGEGSLAQLALTADGLTARISNAEGSLAQLALTADGLTSRISDAEGNISVLQQTASGLTSAVTDVRGNISLLQQTVGSVTASVADVENGLSQTLRVGADGVTITNAAGSRVTIDGGQIRADTLELTGRITFSDLDSGTQGSINGAYSAASSASSSASAAASLARSIMNGTASGTFISGQTIYSPIIYSNLLEIVATSNAGGLLMEADFNGSTYEMLEISYWEGPNPYVDITSPNNATIRFNFDRKTYGIKFYGDVDFSGANVTGLD